ncbi:hypothetical protein Q4E40_18225 [Pontibacter sp. BT731]|uniref:hypothetical protein n=1 Tax=Pontibacter coccineus TaxID=3063328 RepID=UPI0026E4674F|nr:hypothetical protein [Pontibacter sp. BT731]MDO6392078.1 hypothetical protein [Pontibacter sp. BT731]
MSQQLSKKPTGFYPLAVNIIHLQKNYSGYFDLQEIVVFEWFMVKANSFKKYNEFYYSIRRICEETFIKKARLDTILSRFSELGIISFTTKGMPKQHHFQVNKNRVLEHLPLIYKLSEKDKLLTFFNKQLPEKSKHKEYYKNSEEDIIEEKKGLLSEKEFSDSGPFLDLDTAESNINSAEAKAIQNENDQQKLRSIQEEETRQLEKSIEHQQLLNELYSQRVALHNLKGKRGKPLTKLAFTNNDKFRLYKLFERFDEREILASFTAYIDEVISSTTKSPIKKVVSYFLAADHEDEFSTFLTYLNKYTATYGYDLPSNDW